MEDLRNLIRDVPDFPKKGIVFKDITTLLSNGPGFKKSIDRISDQYEDKNIEIVIGVESRGFIFAASLAYKLGAGLVIVRKPGKLPYKTYSATYELEYGTDELQIHQDAIKPGQRVLIVDDLLATGGTTAAVIDLVKKLQGEIVDIAFLIELTFLNGRDRLKGYNISSIIQY